MLWLHLATLHAGLAQGLSLRTLTQTTGFAKKNAAMPNCPPALALKMTEEETVALVVDVGCYNSISTTVFAVFIIVPYDFQ